MDEAGKEERDSGQNRRLVEGPVCLSGEEGCGRATPSVQCLQVTKMHRSRQRRCVVRDRCFGCSLFPHALY